MYEPDGTFIEGTGLYGQSTLRRVDAKTGRTTKSISVDQKYFGAWGVGERPQPSSALLALLI